MGNVARSLPEVSAIQVLGQASVPQATRLLQASGLEGLEDVRMPCGDGDEAFEEAEGDDSDPFGWGLLSSSFALFVSGCLATRSGSRAGHCV